MLARQLLAQLIVDALRYALLIDHVHTLAPDLDLVLVIENLVLGVEIMLVYKLPRAHVHDLILHRILE